MGPGGGFGGRAVRAGGWTVRRRRPRRHGRRTVQPGRRRATRGRGPAPGPVPTGDDLGPSLPRLEDAARRDHRRPPHQRRPLRDVPRHGRSRARSRWSAPTAAAAAPRRQPGLLLLQPALPACEGRGVLIEDPCNNCRGDGHRAPAPRGQGPRPRGGDDGQRIRLKGRGGPAATAARPAICTSSSTSAPHPLFGRTGNDLTIMVPVTFAEAALGAESSCPPSRASRKMRIPAGTRSGRVLRVHGGASPAARHGDLLVTVEVAVPPNCPTRSAGLEALAASTTSPRAHLESEPRPTDRSAIRAAPSVRCT